MKIAYSRPAALAAALVLSMAAAASAAMMGSDSSFARHAGQGGMAEVQMASLAMQKSKNPMVLAFARRMIADHTKANAKLMSIVQSEGMTPPAGVGSANRMVMTKLERLNGAAFNSAYLAAQVTAHQGMLALMRSEAASGSDSRLMRFAKMTAPTVEEHLMMAQSDMKSMHGGSMSSSM